MSEARVHPGQRVRMTALVASIGVVLALASCSSGPPTASTTTSSSVRGPSTTQTTKGSGRVPTTSISFRVKGNKILESNGRQYVPYGFVLWCLSAPTLSSCDSGPDSDSKKIVAAATFWHANTVRLQVAWQHLFIGNSASVNQSFVQMLDSEVSLANSYHMVVIITLQTERYKGSLMPDDNALRFWTFMAKHFKKNPLVFFDLFNEPRLTGTPSEVWKIWQGGGTVSTPTGLETYVGMQQLVDAIRSEGAQNIVVAEGIEKDHLLAGLPALKGLNLAYGTEPSLRTRGKTKDATPDQWQENWGLLSARYPIMMEAFIDYPQSTACNPYSPTLVPQLLAYLESHHLGLLYFTMEPGLAIVGNNLTKPTSFSGPTFDCAALLRTNTQGPGQDILKWFQQNSRPIG